MKKVIKHWQEHLKFRISRADKSRFHHDTIKLACMFLIKKKYNAKKIYSEYPVGKRIADVYFELRESGKMKGYAVEIQKQLSKKYLELAETDYYDMDIQPIIIPEKEISKDLDLLWEQIDKLF